MRRNWNMMTSLSIVVEEQRSKVINIMPPSRSRRRTKTNGRSGGSWWPTCFSSPPPPPPPQTTVARVARRREEELDKILARLDALEKSVAAREGARSEPLDLEGTREALGLPWTDVFTIRRVLKDSSLRVRLASYVRATVDNATGLYAANLNEKLLDEDFGWRCVWRKSSK